MAAEKISGLTAASSANSTDLFETSQSDGMGGWLTKKVTNSQLATLMGSLNLSNLSNLATARSNLALADGHAFSSGINLSLSNPLGNEVVSMTLTATNPGISFTLPTMSTTDANSSDPGTIFLIEGAGSNAFTLKYPDGTTLISSMQPGQFIILGLPAKNTSANGFLTLLFNSAVAGITSGTIDDAVIGGTTPAAGSFTTLTASTPLGAAYGGTGVSSPTQHGVMVGNGSSAMTVVNAGSNNLFLFSSTSASDPIWGSITFDNTFTTNYAANALVVGNNISVTGTQTTTNVQTKSLVSIQIPSNKAITISCVVSAYESTTPTNFSARIFTGAIYNGSTTTVNASPVIDYQTGSTLTGASVTITGGSVNTITVNAVGQSGYTIKWSATLTYTIAG